MDFEWLVSDSTKEKPFMVAMAIAGIILPTSLMIFLTKPDLFVSWPITKVLLLAAAIGAPGLILSMCIVTVYNPEWDYFVKLGTAALFTNLFHFGIAAYAYFRPLRIGASYIVMATILMILLIGKMWENAAREKAAAKTAAAVDAKH